MTGGIFAFACLWEVWKNREVFDAEWIRTFGPAILDEEPQQQAWVPAICWKS